MAAIQVSPVRLAKKKEYEKAWAKNNVLYIRYKAYVQDDARKGVKTMEKIAAITVMEAPCYYCGLDKSGGLDRRDCKDGHTATNVVPCCMWCNQILGDLPPEAKDLLRPGLAKVREQGFFDTWCIPQMRRMGV